MNFYDIYNISNIYFANYLPIILTFIKEICFLLKYILFKI